MPSPDEWFERANELACEEGREAEAEAAYRASGTPDALRWLAWLLETQGRIEEAEAVYREADARHCTRTYWVTEEANATARALYDRVAGRAPFVQYRR